MAIIDLLNREKASSANTEIGIGGFSALVRVNESTTLTSKVPTTYLEDGSFAQDHIIIDPVILSIDGDVSEIHIKPTAFSEDLSRINSNVGVIAQYLPAKTQTQIQQANALIGDFTDRIRQVDKIIADGKQALSFLGNQSPTGKDLQEKFIDAMESLHYGKQLVSIDMPYRRHDNMRITSVQVARDNKGKNIKFKITAQEVRFAATIFIDASEFMKSPAAGLGGQTDGVTDKGPQAGEEVEQSLLFSVRGS